MNSISLSCFAVALLGFIGAFFAPIPPMVAGLSLVVFALGFIFGLITLALHGQKTD